MPLRATRAGRWGSGGSRAVGEAAVAAAEDLVSSSSGGGGGSVDGWGLTSHATGLTAQGKAVCASIQLKGEFPWWMSPAIGGGFKVTPAMAAQGFSSLGRTFYNSSRSSGHGRTGSKIKDAQFGFFSGSNKQRKHGHK